MSEVITTSTTDITRPTLTNEELRKQKSAIYLKEYMKEYHKKRYNIDEEYRQYRIDTTKKSSCKKKKCKCASSVNGRESNALCEWSDAHV